jgi:hypothetical protein
MDVPRLQFQRRAWRQYHEFPLWDPYLWCGQPFLGEIVGAAFPLNWPLFWLPGPDRISLTALNWYFLTLHFLAVLSVPRPDLFANRLPSGRSVVFLLRIGRAYALA